MVRLRSDILDIDMTDCRFQAGVDDPELLTPIGSSILSVRTFV
jgi:hypothetical protein